MKKTMFTRRLISSIAEPYMEKAATAYARSFGYWKKGQGKK
jgi:hypothetical protein